jgi:hypothetical protein
VALAAPVGRRFFIKKVAHMKFLCFTVIPCLLAFGASAQENGLDPLSPPPAAEEMPPPDTGGVLSLDSLLPPDIATVLTKGTIVQAFLLTEWASDTTGAGLLGFRIERRTDSLPPDRKALVQAILTDPAAYDPVPAAKRCLFAPRLGFEVRLGADRHLVLVSTNCDVLKILSPDGKVRFTENVDRSHDRFLALAKTLFPDSTHNRRNS